MPLAVSALLAAGAMLPAPPLRDAVTRAPATDVALRYPAGYSTLAPMYDVLDMMSLLSVEEHAALLATVAVGFGIWRARRPRPRRRRRPLWPECRAGLALFAAAVAVYGGGMVIERPMAALSVGDEEVVVVDFHSHTTSSKDGRPGFDAEDNRRWHAAGGFHAAYVTDHRNWVSATEGGWRNPARAGDGTVLLPGIEARYGGEHIVALGAEPRWLGVVARNRMDMEAFADSVRAGGAAAAGAVILTLPAFLDEVPTGAPDGIGRLHAVEISDAAPRGLGQARRERDALLQLADSLGLVMVAGSNNHGWARTAAAWTLVRVPGWRTMSPRALAEALEARLRTDSAGDLQVIERRPPSLLGTTPVAVAATAPLLAWTAASTLDVPRRAAWLAWTWGAWTAWLAWRGLRSWRSRRRLQLA
ncbi:MAG TPA: hypothetical protein VNA89_13645 [Gemmatimonadaceae bacterium]|nr:hypothetical protein [Gemmatimonadaceae bacterium]